jgi:hypothetical protein
MKTIDAIELGIPQHIAKSLTESELVANFGKRFFHVAGDRNRSQPGDWLAFPA